MFDERFKEWDDRSKAIDTFRLLAILCMIFTHVKYDLSEPKHIDTLWQMYTDLLQMPFVDSLIIFLKYGVARVASPALAMVSAWFLMKSINERTFLQILKNKSKNLLIPYFFWGSVLFLMVYVGYLAIGRDPHGFGEHSFLFMVYERVLDVSEKPLNYPLYFLWDLFVITVAYALVHPFFKNRPKVLLVFALVWPLALSVSQTTEQFLGGNDHSVLPRADLVFYYLLGVVTYRHKDVVFDKHVIRVLTHPAFLIAIGVFVFLLSRYMYFSGELNKQDPNVLLFYFGCFCKGIAGLFVFASALKIHTKFNFVANRKIIFRIFCTHAITLYFLNIVIEKFIGHQEYLAVYIGAYLLAILGGYIVHIIIEYLAKITQIKAFRYI